MDRTGRDNDKWLLELRGGGADQQAALAVLRESLLRGLRRGLSSPASNDDSFLEDAVQESLLRILDRLSQFEGRSRFLTWAVSISIRVALGELRRRRWQDVSLDELTADSTAGLHRVSLDGQPRPDKQWERSALLETMQALIDSELTEKQRAALIAELKGMPQEEIARHLGSNRNAVYKLTHDARKRLKQALEAAGYDAADVQSAFAT
jgi:RNA polymerase sigma-70 factor (ECF subfamily)